MGDGAWGMVHERMVHGGMVHGGMVRRGWFMGDGAWEDGA